MNKAITTNALAAVAVSPRFLRCSERSTALYIKAISLWRWPSDIHEAGPFLFGFFGEFRRDRRLRCARPSLSAYEEMQVMFVECGLPGTKDWSDTPFDGLPMEAFVIAFAFYHHHFAEEKLRSASYFFGTGFRELTDELLDAAEINLAEAEQMLERLPVGVQLTAT